MKQFECFWGAGYRDNDNKSIIAYHNQDFFTLDRGYEQDDINDIGDLYINEIKNLDCVTGQHWVRRVS